jgi:hypothetical protein
VIYAAVLWIIWKLRNILCFQGMRRLMLSCARLLRNWALLNKCEDAARLEAWARELKTRGARPERQTWRQSDDVLNVQTSRRADLMSMSFSRLQELSADSVVWTENGCLHVGIDAAGGNCNTTYTGELSFE